jgi:hypothetical protein
MGRERVRIAPILPSMAYFKRVESMECGVIEKNM